MSPEMSSPPRYPFQPLKSSPLNDSQSVARRRLQFKSQSSHSSTLASPLTSRRTRSTPSNGTSSPHFLSRQDTGIHFAHAEDPQKQLLRERMRAKCIERVQKARARAVKQRRYTGYSDRSSDGFDMDIDEEDEEDEENDSDIVSEEFFRRMMDQMNRKIEHHYQLSYAQEVGSSFDPDMEDIEEWEREIPGQRSDPSPVDWDDEELEAYAEECARQAAQEKLFNLRDIDDIPSEPSDITNQMDLS